jgi:hypothetical protein
MSRIGMKNWWGEMNRIGGKLKGSALHAQIGQKVDEVKNRVRNEVRKHTWIKPMESLVNAIAPSLAPTIEAKSRELVGDDATDYAKGVYNDVMGRGRAVGNASDNRSTGQIFGTGSGMSGALTLMPRRGMI